MKKIILMIALAFVILQPSNIFALENNETYIEYEYLENGYYFETIITYDNPVARTSSVTAHKTTTYKSASGNTLWSVTVYGTFTYNGSTSKCTSASVSTSAPDPSWKITSKSSSKSGNTAKATATTICYLNGNPINSATKTVTLKCSASGTLS